MQRSPAPQLPLDRLLEKHPLPWTHHSLMIKDANGRQVIHLGGIYDGNSRLESGEKLSALNALLVERANRIRRQPAPETETFKHTPGGWSWEFEDAACQRPVVLAGGPQDVIMFTVDAEDNPILVVDSDDQLLLERAFQVPHKCDDEDCQGNINRQKLERLELIESAFGKDGALFVDNGQLKFRDAKNTVTTLTH